MTGKSTRKKLRDRKDIPNEVGFELMVYTVNEGWALTRVAQCLDSGHHYLKEMPILDVVGWLTWDEYRSGIVNTNN